MCNRYFQEHQLDKIERSYRAVASASAAQARLELYPGYDTLAIREREGERELTSMHWGLIPMWVKEADLPKFTKPNNARDDTIIKSLAEKKGMMYAPMKNGRCILPGSAWCEWTGEKGSKLANRLSVKDRPLFAFAGLCTYREGFPGLSCTMVTTEAEGRAREFHHRIPVILRDEDVDRWLNPESDPFSLTELFRCLPEDELEVVPMPDDRRVKATSAL